MDLLEEILKASKHVLKLPRHAVKKLWKITKKLVKPRKKEVPVYSFAHVVLKVDLQHPMWHKSINSIKRNFRSVRAYNQDGRGVVSMSGSLSVRRFWKKMGRLEGKVRLESFEFGQCSSYLYGPSGGKVSLPTPKPKP